MKRIYLQGELKKFHAEPISAAIDNTRHLLQMLTCWFGSEIKQYFREHPECVVVVSGARGENARLVSKEYLTQPYEPEVEEIHIFTPPEGAGGLEAAIAYGLMTSFSISATTAIAISGAIINVSIALALGAVSRMLAPKPQAVGSERPDQAPSFIYSGAVNVTEPGYQLPVVFGTFYVGSAVLSAGVTVEQLEVSGTRDTAPGGTSPTNPPAEPDQWAGGV